MPVDAETAASLPEHVRALLSAAAYHYPVEQVELIQTHVSYVLLAGNHVYKLKKALDLGFLDFTSLEQRQRACLEEVRLNSRTCPALYYGVASISHDGQHYRVDAPGEIVDYAVHMRRLPDEGMLSNLLMSNSVTFDMMGWLVWKIVRFHDAAEGGERVRKIGGYETMVENWLSNLRDISSYLGHTISPAQFDTIRSYGEEFTDHYRPLFRQREAEDRVRDCHGDLRADAVCFDSASPDGVCIFDCIEFSERFRYSDTGLDIAFLAMDIEWRGHPELADVLLSLYTAACGDKTLPLVSSYYRCYRALVRGKVASILADQKGVPQSQRDLAIAEARRHFALAEQYARPNLSPRVILVMGLTGSGKSLLAGALAHRTGAALVSSDIVRKELASVPPTNRRSAAIESGLYSPETTERVYREMAEQADNMLANGHAVILDGTYLTSSLRNPIAELARRRSVPLHVVECRASEDVVRQRQERRAAEPWTASDATWDIYLSQKQRYVPPNEFPSGDQLTLDTDRPLSALIEEVLTCAPLSS